MSFGMSLTGLNGATRELEVRGDNMANVGMMVDSEGRHLQVDTDPFADGQGLALFLT